jgi:D-alanyl-D-alanine carboxypeptidase
MNNTQTNIDKANKTQTNINKAVKPAAETAAKPAAPAANTPTTKPAAKPANKPAKKKRRKIRIKPNKSGILALLALILLTAAIVTAVVFLVKGTIHWVDTLKNTTGSSSSDNGSNNTTPWNNAYAPISHPNTNITLGKEGSSLILVNTANSYSLADSISSQTTNLWGYEGYNTHYVLPGSDTRVHNSILPSLLKMITDLVEADPSGAFKTTTDKLFITGAYRNITLQTTLNTNYPQTHPEAPGYSEHHTGLAFDLKVMSNSAPIQLRDSEYEWLEAHCAEYGFIIRYEASKSALTGIVDEPYHFRYVGVSHATYMTANNLCLEEYLELLRTSHSYDKTPLEFSAGDKDYLVYYVAADTAEGATFTSVPVPPASEGTYTISGDNMNGFIVTVTKTAK